jgi:ribosomal protein S18 acetylase RimI-like enzyme
MLSVTIRPATAADIPSLAAMAGKLARLHHGFDPLRFMLPDDIESGYAWWLGRELPRKEVVLRVAERAGAVVGYTYARLEERDWNSLLDACGALHDIWVEEEDRTAGVGAALLAATLEALRALGAPRVVLSTATPNVAAQRLFARHGFRATMIEMTCEL